MNSLRGRLTFSYAIVVALVLWIVSLLACRIAFGIAVHRTFEALSLGVARAESVAAGVPQAVDTHTAVRRVVEAARAPGVIAFAFAFGGPGGGDVHRGPAGERSPRAYGAIPGPPPADDGAGPPGGGPPDPFGDRRLRAGPSFSARMLAGSVLGLSGRTVAVRGFHVFVVPDMVALDPVLRIFMWVALAATVLSALIAWALASWLANQAILPLLTVTRELERFSAGDFTPRPLTTSDCSELGALITAYNGAAAQVTSAFNERLEVEVHMRRFVADAGHELRTPLTVIGGYLEILRKGGINDPATRERALGTLNGEARRMRVLIDRLLALARLERPDLSELTRVDLRESARDAAAHVRAARGGDISVECAAETAVFADPAELAEALENLIDNAVKYGRGTPVTVRVDRSSDEAFIRVCDGGEGIPPAERPRLFERFFRGDERGEVEGSGLGLAIADRAIRRCGGSVALEDGRPGHTTFVLRIPLASTQAAPVEPLRL